MVIMQQTSEITIASLVTEHLADSSRLLEIVLERGNMFRALKRVRDNKGVPGIDKMNVNQLPGYLKRHWLKIREELLNSTYKPLPVRRKEISKQIFRVKSALDTCQAIPLSTQPVFSVYDFFLISCFIRDITLLTV